MVGPPPGPRSARPPVIQPITSYLFNDLDEKGGRSLGRRRGRSIQKSPAEPERGRATGGRGGNLPAECEKCSASGNSSPSHTFPATQINLAFCTLPRLTPGNENGSLKHPYTPGTIFVEGGKPNVGNDLFGQCRKTPFTPTHSGPALPSMQLPF